MVQTMSTVDEQSEPAAAKEYSERELVAKLGGGPYDLAVSTTDWPKSFAFLRHIRTVENFQHAVWGLAENPRIEDRDVCGAIESYLRHIPNGMIDWVHQLKFEQLSLHKFSPIAKLIHHHRLNAATILLDAGFDPDFPCDSKGRTSVQACIFGGNSDVVGLNLLLDRGANPRGDRPRGLCQGHVAACLERPLFCIWKRFLPNVELPLDIREQHFIQLISSGAPIDELDYSGSNIAHVLCTVGSLESISDLISMRGDDAKSLFVAARKSDGLHPIHIACAFGHAHIIPSLISLGARPNARIDSTPANKHDYCCLDLGGSTCFFLALMNGKSSSAAMCILKKLDAKAIASSVHSESGTTPLHWCVWHHLKAMKDTIEHVNLVNALIAGGCSLNQRDNAGRLPIHLACAGSHHSLIPILAPSELLINDRLAMASHFFAPTTSPKASRMHNLAKRMIKAPAEAMAISDVIPVDDQTPAGGAPTVLNAGIRSAHNDEPITEIVDGVTPLLFAIMSRDVQCVKTVLAVPGILRFKLSSEPRASISTKSPPKSPVTSHFVTSVNPDVETKLKFSTVASITQITNDVCNKLKSFNPSNHVSKTIANAETIDIHSPLSYAIVTAQFSMVEIILDAFSEDEPIVYLELIQSKFRCKDDFLLALVSSIVKYSELSLLPPHFQALLPTLGDAITSQLDSIPNFTIQDDSTNDKAANLDDIRVHAMLSGVSKIIALPKVSEGMPVIAGSESSGDRNRLGYIHMACILGYSLCCEVLMKENPLQNYSLRIPTGLISPLHLSIIYKRLACVESLIKLSPKESLCVCIQEPLLNHMLPIHIALLSGNINTVTLLCSIFNTLNVSNDDSIACHAAFVFQLLARAGSGYDLEIVSLQGSLRFACIALNTFDAKIENSSIYSNHLQIGYNGGSLKTFLDAFELSNTSVFAKLAISYIDCLVICSMYGLTSHCRYLLSKAVPSTNRKALGFFSDTHGTWIPMQVSLFHDWSKMNEISSWTPVNIAVHRGHREIMKLLIAHGNDCNTRSPLGWTPLTLACFNGDEDLVDMLLKNRVLASRPDAAGWTPVMVCVAKLGLRRVRYSLEVTGEWSIEGARDRLCNNVLKGLTHQEDDESRRAPLVMSMFDQPQELSAPTKDHNLSIMNMLLKQCNPSTECSPNGWSALFTAICLQQLSVAKNLLASLADVNVGCVDGRQPLFAACSIPHVPLVMHLLKLGANPNPIVPQWRTKLTLQSVSSKEGPGPLLPQYQCLPIVAACKMGSLSAALALISACHSAATFPDLEIVKAATSACIESISMHVLGLLLVHPVTRNHAAGSVAESFHATCLLSLMLWAADACQMWALRAAVAYGGDINGTKNGTSSLHIACSRPQAFSIALYLVEQVRSQIYDAARVGVMQMIAARHPFSFSLSQGADIYLRDAFSRTAYQVIQFCNIVLFL